MVLESNPSHCIWNSQSKAGLAVTAMDLGTNCSAASDSGFVRLWPQETGYACIFDESSVGTLGSGDDVFPKGRKPVFLGEAEGACREV